MTDTQQTAPKRAWTLGSRFMERELCFDPALGLYTARWVHRATGTDFVQQAREHKRWSSEFFFNVDGERVTSATFDLVDARSSKDHTLELLLRDRSKPIYVTMHYVVNEEYPAVRQWVAITNTGDSPITLSRLCFEHVPLLTGAACDVQLASYYGIMPRELLFTGRVEDAMLIQENACTGEGFAALNEAPGYLKRTESSQFWEGGMSLMYDTDLFPFERRLLPGETFTSAKGTIIFFVRDHPSADPRRVIPAFTSQVLLKKGANYRPPWIYNTWEPFHDNVDASLVNDLIPIAARMGMDIFTIDDGWQADYGENDVHPVRFPGGLDAILAAVESQGMRLGLWVPLAVVGADTEVAQEHPEWVCHEADGQPKLTKTARGIKVVMCLASPYRDIAASRINELIDRYHLKYLKIDLTTMFNTYGETPGCHAAGHDHLTWAESLVRLYEAIQAVCDRVYQAHPDVLLDLTFELWGQKHVIDYGLLAAGDLDWLSNVHDTYPGCAGPRQVRTLLYHRSLAIPTEAMLIGNLEAQTSPIEERFATAIGSGPLLLGDLRQLTEEQQDWYAHKIQWFKKLRRDVPISESFFPLGAWMQPSVVAWDGFARLSHQGKGIVVLFRNDSSQDAVTLALPVIPEGRYQINSAMSERPLGTYSAAQLKNGITIPWQSRVEILEIRKL